MATTPAPQQTPQPAKPEEETGLFGSLKNLFSGNGLSGFGGGFMQLISMFLKMLTGGGFGDFMGGLTGSGDHPLSTGDSSQGRGSAYKVGHALRSGWDGVLDVIGLHESRGDYNVAYGGKKADFTNMSINQVLQWQDQYVKDGSKSSAVGKYQIIRKTLEGLKAEMGLSGNEKFDQKMQDNMARRLLQDRGLDAYAAGNMTTAQIINSISKEWASVANTKGVSAYEGIAGNHASLGNNEMAAALTKARTHEQELARNNETAPAASSQKETVAAAKDGGEAKAEFNNNAKMTAFAISPHYPSAYTYGVFSNYDDPAQGPVNQINFANPGLGMAQRA